MPEFNPIYHGLSKKMGFGWALAHPEFWGSVNPIPGWGGADYAQQITAFLPGFEKLSISLNCAGQLLWVV